VPLEWTVRSFVEDDQPGGDRLEVATPLTFGAGYVYKASYGWSVGVGIATLASMAGSLLGSCSCFLLGQYIMRERVRKWGRRYPLFDAVEWQEAAESELREDRFKTWMENKVRQQGTEGAGERGEADEL